LARPGYANEASPEVWVASGDGPRKTRDTLGECDLIVRGERGGERKVAAKRVRIARWQIAAAERIGRRPWSGHRQAAPDRDHGCKWGRIEQEPALVRLIPRQARGDPTGDERSRAVWIGTEISATLPVLVRARLSMTSCPAFISRISHPSRRARSTNGVSGSTPKSSVNPSCRAHVT